MRLKMGFLHSGFIGAMAFIVLSNFLLSPALAAVSVSVSLSNDEGTLTDSTHVNGGKFGSSMILLPYSGFADIPFSAYSIGGGESTDPSQNSFSSSSSMVNGEAIKAIGANVATTHGAFGFTKEGTMSESGTSLAMSVGSGTVSGSLDATFSNFGSEARNIISANNAIYFNSASISPQMITSRGTGVPTGSGESGFISALSAQGGSIKATIDTQLTKDASLKTDVNFDWADKTTIGSKIEDFGQAIHIGTVNDKDLALAMPSSPNSINALIVSNLNDMKSGKSIIGGPQFLPNIIGLSGLLPGQPVYFSLTDAPGKQNIDMLSWMHG
jgi:hypothetical protein